MTLPPARPETAPLTGRLTSPPADVLREDVLDPQFRSDVERLLPHFLLAEKALLTEYHRLGLVDAAGVVGIAAALDALTTENLVPDPARNLSDLALAIEQWVTGCTSAPAWHVDRSRNDLQACAQLMRGRENALLVAGDLLAAADSARRLAGRYVDSVLPGYTHLQAAQVVSPGFYVSALSAHLLHSADRMLATYDGFNLCPLGSGALAGQELPWDRERLAALLAFAGPQRHALVGVASRAWLLELAGECATAAVGLSRFVTDLMTWAGSDCGYVELPDHLAGISAAMPQKKNYPIFERIRGRTAHLSAWYLDVSMTQRATPFSNSVEVSKEGAASSEQFLGALRSALRMLVEVLDNAVFRTDRTAARCDTEFLGGLSLANRLTLDSGVPWRAAQVIAGRYITACLAAGLTAGDADAALLTAAAAEDGYTLENAEHLLSHVFEPASELRRRQSAGSTHPREVAGLLQAQSEGLSALIAKHTARVRQVRAVPATVDRALATVAEER